MRVWLTKYALSEGISLQEVSEKSTFSGYVYLKDRSWSSFRLGKDVFERKEDALADAENRRIKKIKSLQKQIAALSSLKFDAQTPQP